MEQSLYNRVFTALEHDTLKLHGSYQWGSHLNSYGQGLNENDATKLEYIQSVLSILNDPFFPVSGKVRDIIKIPGFGISSATCLTMIFHPQDCGFCNHQTQNAMEKLGFEISNPQSFQDAIRHLREQLKADDYLELDRFLYLIFRDQVQISPQN